MTFAATSPALPDSTLGLPHQRVIADSHERCRALGLRTEQTPDLSLLAIADLRVAQERNRTLCAQALPVMELLWEQLAQTQGVVGLTDSRGIVLHTLGDSGFLERAQRIALATGAIWSEAAKGTNAVGTALMTEEPTIVHGREHFLSATQFLTCSGVPMFDHTGAVMGVLGVSGDHRSFHPHTLGMARISARMIENHWFADRFRHDLKLHLHASAHGLGTVQEGVIALDHDGRILGANRAALEMVGRSAAMLRRESLEALFGIGLTDMVDHARRSGGAAMVLPLARGAQRSPGEPGPVVWAPEPGQLPVRQPRGEATSLVHVRLSLDAVGLSRASVVVPSSEAAGASAAPAAAAPFGAAVTARAAPRPVESGMAPGTALAPASEVASAVAVSIPAAAIPAGPAPVTLREREHEAIRQAVAAARGNMTRAARTLGIGRSTLYRKWREMGAG